jgi:hypothetical protein
MQLHPGSVFSFVTEPFRIRLLLLVWESYNRVSMSSALSFWPQLRKQYARELSVDDQPLLLRKSAQAAPAARRNQQTRLPFRRSGRVCCARLLKRTAGGKKAAKMLSGEVVLRSDLFFGLFKRIAAFTGRKLIMS